MKTGFATFAALGTVALTAVPCLAQTEGPTRQLTPPIMEATEAPMAVALPVLGDDGTQNQAATAPVSPRGEWLYTADQGYVWVPLHSTSYLIASVPSAYLYTPESGWAWYRSPWGEGPFAYGAWVGHPSSVGFQAWTRGAAGWSLHGVGAPRIAGNVFGAPGHYYDAEGSAYRSDHAFRGSVREPRAEGAREAATRATAERSSGGEHGGSGRGAHR